jgi:phospholipase/carboxylesterase
MTCATLAFAMAAMALHPREAFMPKSSTRAPVDRPAVATRPPETAAPARLLARPRSPQSPERRAGRLALHFGAVRDGYLYVPEGVSSERATPLVVFFHGAGGRAEQAEMIRPLADRHQVLVLATDARATTWDVIVDEIGPDVTFLDRALHWTFDRFTVDPSRVAATGFSDGASYALSLGLANGDLFTNVVAFSPGFAAPPDLHGKSRIFISHGADDRVLPIDRCSREIVPRLRRRGYDVDYREFDGPHTVPPEVAASAFAWLLR